MFLEKLKETKAMKVTVEFSDGFQVTNHIVSMIGVDLANADSPEKIDKVLQSCIKATSLSIFLEIKKQLGIIDSEEEQPKEK